MRTRGPIVTLLAVVVVAFALLAANMFGGGRRSAEPDAQSAATAPAALAAPPPSAPAAFPTQASYAGRTAGRKAGEATVEIAIQNGMAIAYVCDGKKLESWLQGSVSGSALTLRGKGGDELTAERAASAGGASLTGRVKVAGGQWSFTAKPGQAPNAEKRVATLAVTKPVPNPTSPKPGPNPVPSPPASKPAPNQAPPVEPDDSAEVNAAPNSSGY